MLCMCNDPSSRRCFSLVPRPHPQRVWCISCTFLGFCGLRLPRYSHVMPNASFLLTAHGKWNGALMLVTLLLCNMSHGSILIGTQEIWNGWVSKPKKVLDMHQTLFLARGWSLGTRLEMFRGRCFLLTLGACVKGYNSWTVCVRACVRACVRVYIEKIKIKFMNGLVHCLPRTD